MIFLLMKKICLLNKNNKIISLVKIQNVIIH